MQTAEASSTTRRQVLAKAAAGAVIAAVPASAALAQVTGRGDDAALLDAAPDMPQALRWELANYAGQLLGREALAAA